jgi:hypothetical protein
MTPQDYWTECLESSADEHGISLTNEQARQMAKDAMLAQEHYGMAFYSPPDSDRIADIGKEWQAKYQKLEREFEAFRRVASNAVRRALPNRVYHDTPITIEADGSVFAHGGRTERIL